MQQLDSFYETAIREGHSIEGSPLVIAEWNFNQIFDPIVTNVPDDQNWLIGQKNFPPESVANTIRPVATGILAAMADDAYTDSEETLDSTRYYSIGGDTEELFAYWVCPTISHLEPLNSAGTSEDDSLLPQEYGVDRGTLLLEYPTYINANKIRVLFNLGPVPVTWSIFLHTEGAPGDGYVEVINPTVDLITGKAELWWDGASWTEGQQLDQAIYKRIDKIKIVVESVDQPDAYLQVVEVAAGREIDLSNRIEEYSIGLSMDDVDFIHPVGQMASDEGKIVFSNDDLKINNNDPESDFYGLLAGRCQYRTYVQYDLTNYGGTEWICRTGTMYANDWQQENEYEYSVELWDSIKLLQTKKCPAHLFEDLPIAKVVGQILDFIGLNNYALSPDDFAATNKVKYFWTDGTQTVYEALNSLCASYQCAIYVDEFDVINLLSRSEIANELDTPVWTFRGRQDGSNLPDIESLSKKYNLQANQVTIKYKQMQAPSDALDITSHALTSKLWESTDTVVLRASPLIKNVSADGISHEPTSDKDIRINSNNIKTWPYKGKANLDGELIEYEGKGYLYWNYATNPPTAVEAIITSDDEKKKWDAYTYNSFQSIDPLGAYSTIGGISTNPTKQNAFTGRLHVTKRDADGLNKQAEHSIYWNYGWMPMKAWIKAPGNPSFPTRYVEPGGSVYNMNNLKDYINKPNWNTVQTRWSRSESIVSCNNAAYAKSADVNCLIRDLEDTEFREMGTRLRFTTNGYAGIIFYLSNAVGYDNVSSGLTDPLLATRYYLLTIGTTEEVESHGRYANEITLEAKNGNNISYASSVQANSGSAGKWQVDVGKWYDIDIVVRDGDNSYQQGFDSGPTQIEVYLDGQWVDTFTTNDHIRPTSLAGLHARWGTNVDFEYFYATTTTTNQRPLYNDDDFFTETVQLPAGTNVKKQINLPKSEIAGEQAVVSLSTFGSNATVSSLIIKGSGTPGWTVPLEPFLIKSKQFAPLVIKPDTRIAIDFDSAAAAASVLEIIYTSTNDISLCYESTKVKNLPYTTDTNITPTNSYFDNNSYSSLKLDDLAYASLSYPLYWIDQQDSLTRKRFFMDDFGSIVREVRDFDVEYDVSPAKGVRIYSSNNKIRVFNHQYNPVRGIFSMVNASHRDEIINGTEEIDETNSIDHSLLLYGYILEDKGDKTKVIKNDGSMRKYGPVVIDLDANWVFNEDDATALGDWIITNWSDPMDTIDLTVFSNTFIQVGDKVNILYDNANIDSDWLYIVSAKHVSFNDNGLETSVELRRVR